jgi:hypothetical protein
MQDLNTRVERLSTEIVAAATTDDDNNNNYKNTILRPKFTIRNKDIPLEGRLDDKSIMLIFI